MSYWGVYIKEDQKEKSYILNRFKRDDFRQIQFYFRAFNVIFSISQKIALGNVRETAELIEEILDTILDTIKDALKKEGIVSINNFGKFIVRFKRARPGRNPKSGEKVTVAARKVVTFKPSKFLQNAIKEGVIRSKKTVGLSMIDKNRLRAEMLFAKGETVDMTSAILQISRAAIEVWHDAWKKETQKKKGRHRQT
ncbi:MAG: HU family DNA-binding protein [Candidatus Sungbacteria bacterium]|nr:HU family DNA-binding protein [Candidatus Sungbacteria bacterium]